MNNIAINICVYVMFMSDCVASKCVRSLISFFLKLNVEWKHTN